MIIDVSQNLNSNQYRKTILSKLNLITNDGTPTNTAMALFCRDNGIQIQLAIFATDTKITFNDIEIRNIMSLLFSKTGLKSIIQGHFPKD